MSIPKVCGIETEYGILVRGADNNPVSASSLLINAYLSTKPRQRPSRIGWDFEDEQPGNDARGFRLDDAMSPDIEMHLVNAVLDHTFLRHAAHIIDRLQRQHHRLHAAQLGNDGNIGDLHKAVHHACAVARRLALRTKFTGLIERTRHGN